MKFFIFTCLLAVAFAKHITRNDINEMEHIVSSIAEESPAEITEKVKLTVEENYLKQLDKANQINQKLDLLQFIKALYQQQIMNNHNQTKKSAWPFTFLNKDQHSTAEETTKKIADMESSEEIPEKIELTEEQKNSLKYMKLMNQYFQKLAFLQYQYLRSMYPVNHNVVYAYPQFSSLV